MKASGGLVIGCVVAVCGLGMGASEPLTPCGIPAAVTDIEATVPFVVATPYRNPGMRDDKGITRGHVVVVRVDPALVAPRAEAMPVLYAASGVVEIVCSDRAGRVVALVPGDVDLDRTPLWFGKPAFPDRIDVKTVESALVEASGAGVEPMPRGRLDAARLKGGDVIVAANRAALFANLRPIVEANCWQ